jgi:hypothetical protein
MPQSRPADGQNVTSNKSRVDSDISNEDVLTEDEPWGFGRSGGVSGSVSGYDF